MAFLCRKDWEVYGPLLDLQDVFFEKVFLQFDVPLTIPTSLDICLNFVELFLRSNRIFCQSVPRRSRLRLNAFSSSSRPEVALVLRWRSARAAPALQTVSVQLLRPRLLQTRPYRRDSLGPSPSQQPFFDVNLSPSLPLLPLTFSSFPILPPLSLQPWVLSS